MPTGQTLAQVTELLKAEIDDSLSVGTANDARYYLLLEQMQLNLSSEFDWAVLRDYWNSTVTGQFNTVPTVDRFGNTKSIDFDRDIQLYVYYSRRFQPVVYGIDVPEWNTFDPNPPPGTGPYVQDPVQRWQFKQDDNSIYEVWPLPASTPWTVRFDGWRQLNTLRDGSGALDPTKTLELDGRLVALSVAMDMQVDKLAPSAARIQQKLAHLMTNIRGNDNARPNDNHIGYSTAPWANPRRRLVGAKIIVTA